MRFKITTLPGDGIGPEVTAEAVRVLQTIAGIHGLKFEFEEHAIGGVAIKKFGSPLPRTTVTRRFFHCRTMLPCRARVGRRAPHGAVLRATSGGSGRPGPSQESGVTAWSGIGHEGPAEPAPNLCILTQPSGSDLVQC